MGKTPVPDALKRLVENFDRNLAGYHSPAYNETQLRRDFLDPFFEALGWDVANRKGYDQRYREVIHEDAIKVGGTTKAPDYCFRVGGVRKFFLEAKAPVRDIGRDPAPAFQLRRYAWTARLPVSLLSDFEELSVYDTRVRPNERDKAGTSRLKLVQYRDYEREWEELVDTFSPEAIKQGAFDRFVEKGKRRGTTPVDAEFLKDIERRRDLLARNIALRNPRLSDRQLNQAVQRTIDRIIFLRICEDRGIEPAGGLQALTNGPRIYPRLFELFQKADDRYNSGLFHFDAERGREEPDEIAPKLRVDDATLKAIIGQLYYPSPYEFSVFPADILGQVYEQFLGKVIRLTAGHRAKVEEKPEVRKAGGVYYTPTYIVDYKNTVGKLLSGESSSPQPSPQRGEGENPLALDRERARVRVKKGLTPKQAAKLRILDPACGSGSFLLGAFQYLLDWHRDKYVKDGSDKHRKELYEGPGGEWRLTTQEKKRILLNNIYGVDIDSQAVEVTKLSLLLKVLEGESDQTITNQLKIFRERALPDLASNIKCGNSLIGSDFWQGEQQGLFDDENERLRINAFDWDGPDGFPEIMKSGGFDAVIGNPPWGIDFSPEELELLRRSLVSAGDRSVDSYTVFLESALARLRPGGLLGFITPDTLLRKDDRAQLREKLLTSTRLVQLVETGPVFPAVRDTWCLVSIVENRPPTHGDLIEHRKVSRFIVAAEDRLARFGQGRWDDVSESAQLGWVRRPGKVIGYLASDQAQRVIEKVAECPRLGDLRQNFVLSRGEEGSKFALQQHKSGRFRMVIPKDVERYRVGEGTRVTESSLTPTKVDALYKHPKIWCIRIQKMRWLQRIVSAFDGARDSAGMKTLQIIVSPHDDEDALKRLQAVLASRLANFWCINFLADDMNQTYLEQLPVAALILKPYPTGRRLVELVEWMPDQRKKLPKAKGRAKTTIERQIAATDKAIDELVYTLYGLTDKEIAIVERAGR